MPIYEFYCPDCHTVFSFFSSSVDTEARPPCPRCRRPELGRRPSTFAMVRARGEGDGEEEDLGPLAGLDEDRLSGAMESVMAGMDPGAEDDPRQMARLLRRFGDASGLEPGPRMEEMLRRMEAGEDADALEEELGEGFGEEGEDEGAVEDFFRLKQARGGRARRPRVDRELYFL